MKIVVYIKSVFLGQLEHLFDIFGVVSRVTRQDTATETQTCLSVRSGMYQR